MDYVSRLSLLFQKSFEGFRWVLQPKISYEIIGDPQQNQS